MQDEQAAAPLEDGHNANFSTFDIAYDKGIIAENLHDAMPDKILYQSWDTWWNCCIIIAEGLYTRTKTIIRFLEICYHGYTQRRDMVGPNSSMDQDVFSLYQTTKEDIL